jgi:hypothetical protein
LRSWIPVFVALVLVVPPSEAHGQNRDFCNGFSEGWKTLKGDLTIVPICPIAPITPIGSTPYREGIRAGMSAARRAGGGSGGGSSGGASSRNTQRDFCEGFSVGWKTLKGDLTIVPICPIAPITPIGSTPYREGIRAGERRARRR